MNPIAKLAALTLGASIMTQAAFAAAPDAATDPRIDPQVRAFLAKINKDSSPFWELPQPKPQEILTALQSQTDVDMSGVTTSERTIDQDGRKVKLYVMKPEQMSSNPGVLLFIHGGVWLVGNFAEPSAPAARSRRRLRTGRCVRRIHAAAAGEIPDPAGGMLCGVEVGRRARRRNSARTAAASRLPATRSAAT